jgi:hypothetical protein
VVPMAARSWVRVLSLRSTGLQRGYAQKFVGSETEEQLRASLILSAQIGCYLFG